MISDGEGVFLSKPEGKLNVKVSLDKNESVVTLHSYLPLPSFILSALQEG